MPSVPHVDAGCWVHWPSGSVPAATKPQVPSAPWPLTALLHASHVPAHGMSQQTSLAQFPLWQSVPAVHGAPWGWAPPLPEVEDELVVALEDIVVALPLDAELLLPPVPFTV